jgi:hypothetical protein
LKTVINQNIKINLAMRLLNYKNLKSIAYILTLATIPLVILISSLTIINNRQQDWYGAGYDPSYAYLYNSLNIATFKLVGHIDHPGTTSQVFGGIVVKSAYLIDDQGESSLKDAVLKHPEFYLTVLKIATTVFCSLMLLLFGWIACSYTSNIWLGIIIQLAPFISGAILFNGMVRFSQESMFMLASIAISAMAVIWYKRNDKKSLNYPVIFAVVTGFGMASKIIFAPLMIIPLLCLDNNNQRIRYILFSIIAFVAFTLPILPLYPNMAWWFIRLFLHSGIYGSGELNIVDTASYFTNLKDLLLGEPVLLAAYALNFILLISIILAKLIKPTEWNKKAFLVMVAVFLTQTAGYLITAKHPKVAYLLPYECIAVITLAIVADIISKPFRSFWLKNIVSGLIVIFLAAFLINYGLKERRQLFDTSSNTFYEQAWKIATAEKAVIGVNPGPSPIAAMFFGNAYSRNRYSDDLIANYPDYYTFDSYNNKLIDWRYQEVTLEQLKTKYGNSISVIGFDVDHTIKTITSDSIAVFEKVVTEKAQVAIIK